MGREISLQRKIYLHLLERLRFSNSFRQHIHTKITKKGVFSVYFTTNFIPIIFFVFLLSPIFSLKKAFRMIFQKAFSLSFCKIIKFLIILCNLFFRVFLCQNKNFFNIYFFSLINWYLRKIPDEKARFRSRSG